MSGDERPKEKAAKRRQRYVPHLAEFTFKPTYDWSEGQAASLYAAAKPLDDASLLDQVLFEDCITGMQRIPENSIDLVVADPPFGIGFDGKSSVYNRDVTLVVDGYEEADGSYKDFTLSWLAELPRIMKPQASAYVFSGWTNLDAILDGARKAGLTTLNHLIWHYPFGVYTKRRFVTSHYHILLLVNNPKKYFFNKIENYPEDVWIVKRQYKMGKEKNSTRLPLEVVTRCIDYSSRPGAIVLDPFMGNGTTAVAAKTSFRHFIGFEVNKRLRTLIRREIDRVAPGQNYTPYSSRLPSVEELAELYPRAYKEYLRRAGEK